MASLRFAPSGLVAASCYAQSSQLVVFSCSCSLTATNLVQIYFLFDLPRLKRPRLFLPNHQSMRLAGLDEHWRRNSARIRNQCPTFAAENPTENYWQKQRVLLLV